MSATQGVVYTDLGAAVLKLCEQVEAMANRHCWLARQKTDSHQGQADSGQPVLAGLSVCVEESLDGLEDKRTRHIFYIKATG